MMRCFYRLCKSLRKKARTVLAFFLFITSFAAYPAIDGTSAATAFTSLGMAYYVPSAGNYYFNVNGQQFNTYVATDNGGGWVQVAIETGAYTGGSLPQTDTIPVPANSILYKTILQNAFTNLLTIRMVATGVTASMPALDVTTTNASLLSRIAGFSSLYQGSSDNGIYSTNPWSGTGVQYVNVIATCNNTDTAMNDTIFHPCGEETGTHWVPVPSDTLTTSYSYGQIQPGTSYFQLFARTSPVAIPPPTVQINKTSAGGVGSFVFNGNNGFPQQTLTTTTQNVQVTGTPQSLTAGSTQTTITESKAGYVVTAINCTSLGSGGTATPNLTARSVTLDQPLQ